MNSAATQGPHPIVDIYYIMSHLFVSYHIILLYYVKLYYSAGNSVHVGKNRVAPKLKPCKP